MNAAALWPDLPYPAWRETAATLQLWTQIVGKVRLALTPWLNHGWQVPLYVTARGLGTSPIPVGERDPRDRVRLHRPPPRRAHQPRRGADARARSRRPSRTSIARVMDVLREPRRHGRDQRDAERSARTRSASRRTASTPPTTPPRRIASGARSSRPIASSSCSAPAFSARRARCISSGAASISR